ncbi:MAG TPA: MarR family transcriptional regulator [Candidatus Mediterraneibacter colneyensis]|nr:MarR family transcriptional regulator [Candidatus Mediterraneibacter colneyensis]
MYCDLNNLPTLGMMGIVLHKVMNRAKEMYQEFDLNKSQASILFTLHQRDSMSQKELASRLNVSAPSITSAIQKMEKEDYLTRRPDENDQRVMRLSLTEKGKSCIQSVWTVAENMEHLMFRGMNAEETLLFRRLLVQIHDNLKAE